MDKNLVGVQYIGNKPVKTDNVCNTGAVWASNQVLNFSPELASKLCVHKDVFVLCDFEDGAQIYTAQVKQNIVPVREYKDINSMNLDTLKTFAKVELSKTIANEESDVEKVRALVLTYMREKFAIEDFSVKAPNGVNILSMQVNDDEYKRYLSGDLELKLVPSSLIEEPAKTDNDFDDVANFGMQPKEAFAGEQVVKVDLENVNSDSKAEDPLTTVAKNDNKQDPTLSELVAQMEKPALLKFAKENDVKVANTMTAEVLREKLLAVLNK